MTELQTLSAHQNPLETQASPGDGGDSSACHAALHEVFGFSEFRPLQEKAVRATLAEQDVLVVMPTGAGKSLCFQLPAVLSEGVTVVLSPLVALMRDQVEGLLERTGFAQYGCAYINSLQTSGEQAEVLRSLRAGQLKLVYIAPERFRSGGFLDTLRSIPIARFVVDEAHCISEWGHDFRPDYLGIRGVVESLSTPERRIPLMAVTATATQRVQASIVANLGMHEPAIFIGGFNRPNLHFSVHRCKNEKDRTERLARALPKMAQRGGSGLIYVATRKQCEEVAALASRALAPIGLKAAPYHAGMDASLRNTLQSQWLGGVHTLVATNAFGMGIDKPDVRFVVHYAFPENLESYYQEAGRGGRDGRKSRCVILYHFSDKRLREFFIDNDALDLDAVRQAHQEIQKRTRAVDPGESIAIPRAWWSQSLGWTDVKTRLVLSELERAKVIQRLGESGDETIIHLLRRDLPREAIQRITVDLQRQRDERYARLDEMVSYCRTTACRRRTVLNYFGDGEIPENDGFCCDNCERPAAAVASAPVSLPDRHDRVSMPPQIDGTNIHSLLQGLDALWPHLGKARLNKLLRGAASKEVEKFRNDGSPLYGAVRGASEARVDQFLLELIARGLLHQADEDEYFVCTITRAGREAWQTQAPVDVVPPTARMRATLGDNGPSANAVYSAVAFNQLDEAETALFETLRDWRRREASKAGLPPYCILSDRTIRELAALHPDTEEELSRITGIGPAKLEKFGEAVIEVLRKATGGKGAPVAPPRPNPVPPTNPPSRHAARTGGILSDTIAETYAMLQEGLSVEELAEQRGLSAGTIWLHLEQIIAAGFFDEEPLDALVPPDLRQRIETVLDSLPVGVPIKPVWEALDGEVDYGPIRCVIAHRTRLAAGQQDLDR